MRKVKDTNIYIGKLREVTPEAIKENNIKCIVSVCDKTIPMFDSSIWQFHIKMSDPKETLAPNNPVKVAVSIFSMAQQRADRKGGNVLIHCIEGHNRSALIAALWLVEEGYFLKEAVKMTQVKDNKPWMKDLGYNWED